MNNKQIFIFSPYHCASTTVSHNIGKITSQKKNINIWDVKNNDCQKYSIFKTHDKKLNLDSFSENDIIVLMFRKPSKIGIEK